MPATVLQDISSFLSTYPLTSLATFLLLVSLSYIIYQTTLHPLAKFPGPIICALSDSYKLWITATDRVPEAMIALHAQYGDIVRFGPNDLHFNQPEAIEGIYKRGWQKGDFYLGFDQKTPGLFSERNEAIHGKRKRMFGNNFTPTAIRSYESIVDGQYAILRRRLDRFAESGETFDLRKYITYCIVDILGELAFSEAFGNQQDEDPKKIPRVSEALWSCCIAGSMPSMAGVFEWLKDNLPQSAEVAELLEGRNVIFRLASTNIEKRSKKLNLDERPDMLGRIIAASEEGTGTKLTQEQIMAEAITLVVGGTHTTGNTLHVLFANLSRNEEYLKRCIKEIDERLPELAPSQPCYDITGLEEKLDFVKVCIKENFRKDPVGTFNMPRTVPDPGATIAGVQIPAGTQTSMNIHAFHHNPSVWGSDHDVFNPDRWYEKRTEELSHLVIPYSVGKRSCVGQNLANANILKMTTTLLRCYEFEFVNKDEPMVVVSHGDSDLRTPVLVKVKRRGPVYVG
ncbi:hypothetical protein PRZ48_004147 [Zasmidium cellare]|uniref:Cytochrome P450 n=1 Tax=Zasmidium cellare TaxID=395010 RepID=A0ABR0EXF2_ZASCE|nr:hypothetical protein PRZ48_004147 [Zasmidium cellare]